MSDLNASQSIAFKFFSESVKEIEKQINSTAGLNFFTTEQIDFIVLICDQFQKLVKLRCKSKLIDNLLSYNFPEFFKPSDESNLPSVLAAHSAVEPTENRAETQFSFICDVCEEDVPILNNDLEYSTRSHLSTPYHLEVVSVLRKIKESEASASLAASSSLNSTFLEPQCSPDAASVPKNVPAGNQFSSRVISNSKTTSSQPPGSDTSSNAEKSFQRSAWILSQGQSQYLLWRRSQYYCCLCDAYLPTQHNFDAHVRSFTHKTNVTAERRVGNANVKASKTGSINGNDKQSGRNQVETRARSTSSDNQSGVSQVGTSARSTSDQNDQIIVITNGVRVCTLCNVRLPSEANLVSHTNGFSHRAKAEIFRKTFSALTKALNDVTNSAASASSTSATNVKSNASQNGIPNGFQDFLVPRDGTLYCGLCNVKVPGKAQQDSHFNGSVHKEQLRTMPKKPASKSFTDFIITKDSKRYCILCNINLPGESQLTGHKYGKMHKQKLKEYEEKYLSC